MTDRNYTQPMGRNKRSSAQVCKDSDPAVSLQGAGGGFSIRGEALSGGFHGSWNFSRMAPQTGQRSGGSSQII